MHSTRRSRMAWAWGWRSVARSLRCTAADYGRNRIRDRARRSRSVCPRPFRLCRSVTEQRSSMISSPRPQSRPPLAIVRYGFAIVSVLIAVGLALLLEAFGEEKFLLLMPA